MKAQLVKHGGALWPATEADKERFRKWPQGQVVDVEWKRPRNPQFHRKFFALVNMAYQHSEAPSPDAFLDSLKILAGHYENIALPDGRIWLRPKSISFANMGEDEFDEFYSRCLDAILTHIMPGVDPAEVEKMIMGFM